MKTNYEVAFGYKAVITVNIKAGNEEEAKKIATDYITKNKNFGTKSRIEDDLYKPDGIIDMDATWNNI